MSVNLKTDSKNFNVLIPEVDAVALPDLHDIENLISSLNVSPQKAIPSFKESNITLLNGLKKEVGTEIVESIWGQIKGNLREDFDSGKEDLSSHFQELKCRAETLYKEELIKEVRAAYPEFFTAFENEFPLAIVQKVFLSLNRSYLKTFSQKSASPKTFETHIKEQARIFLLDEIRKNLTTFGTLPSETELMESFLGAQLYDFKSATQGAYFFSYGDNEVLVVKPSQKPNQELFGTYLLSLMGIKTSDLINIDAHSQLGELITKKILSSPNKEAKENLKVLKPQQFTLMSFIPGKVLESVTASEVKNAMNDNSDYVYRSLFEMGEISAGDLLLFYRDRLPPLGIGNLENLMVLEGLQGSIAIDQPASFSLNNPMNAFMNIDPFQKVKEIIASIQSKEDRSCATDIWESLSRAFADTVEQSVAIEAIQDGLISGLKKISKLNDQHINILHKALPEPGNKYDIVEKNAYIKMLESIQETISRDSN